MPNRDELDRAEHLCVPRLTRYLQKWPGASRSRCMFTIIVGKKKCIYLHIFHPRCGVRTLTLDSGPIHTTQHKYWSVYCFSLFVFHLELLILSAILVLLSKSLQIIHIIGKSKHNCRRITYTSRQREGSGGRGIAGCGTAATEITKYVFIV